MLFVFAYIYRPVPSGFHLKCIPEDTAEYLATHWHVANIEYPFECRVRFLKDAISRYGMLGLYSEKDDKYPVSWAGIKPGRIWLVRFVGTS